MKSLRLPSLVSILSTMLVAVFSITACASGKDNKIENGDKEESLGMRPPAPGLTIHEVMMPYELDNNLIDRIAAAGADVSTINGSFAIVPSGKKEDVERTIREFPLPEDIIPAWSYSEIKDNRINGGNGFFNLYFITKTPAIDNEEIEYLSIDHIEMANDGREEIINGHLTDEGAYAFANIMKDNIGKPLAFVLYGKIISAPRINSQIKGGNFQIAGYFENVQKMFDMLTAPEISK